MTAARSGEFDVVLVDDLSRLARDNHLMLSIIAELHFDGIRVISVADGLDSTDEDSTLAIQVRGIFNELQLRDLKKKTLRGHTSQKERGLFVGEKTFGLRSVPAGEMKMDTKGWSPATVSRILDNEKYAGRWIWNKTESRRDPKTGRRRRFEKPESEWVINEDA
jgi:DNA invertase Pin-like site-specific DNA recombinase